MTTTTSISQGRDLLSDPRLNRGTAFTVEERSALGLEGLLPAALLSLEDQAKRSYEQYLAQPTDLAKNDFLAALHDRNEVLYYKLLEEHLKEMLPVVYDPVVAQAIERYSHEFQRPDGVYLSVDDIDNVEAAFRNYGLGADDVDLVVATDAEEILGIGDWGANGIAISIGKLAVYTAAAGIHPDRVIPVMLDVGTDRESLLNDPLYVGNRHSRVRGERYDQLIAAYVETAGRLFPNALLHFEDFGPSNARRILNEYRGKARIFNDDMQGTGAITLAAILAGMRAAGSRPSEQRVVIFGAGTAGVGIADQIRAVMLGDGLSEDEATERFWLVDKQGLLVDDMSDLRDFQQPYARSRSEVSDWKTQAGDGSIGLYDVVERAPDDHRRYLDRRRRVHRADHPRDGQGRRAAADLPAIESDRADRGGSGGRDQVDRRSRPGGNRDALGSGPLQGCRVRDRPGQQRVDLPWDRPGDDRLAGESRHRWDAPRGR